MLRASRREAASLRMVAALNKQRKKRKCWIQPWLGRRNALGAYNSLLQELYIRLLLTTMAFSTKNLLKSCWKIEPHSIPSNIAARHVFVFKSAFTRGKIFIAQYCQQSYSMILRGTLHTDRILRQESFCKKLDRVKPALVSYKNHKHGS